MWCSMDIPSTWLFLLFWSICTWAHGLAFGTSASLSFWSMFIPAVLMIFYVCNLEVQRRLFFFILNRIFVMEVLSKQAYCQNVTVKSSTLPHHSSGRLLSTGLITSSTNWLLKFSILIVLPELLPWLQLCFASLNFLILLFYHFFNAHLW